VSGLPDIVQLVQTGATNAWLLLPLAVILGAIHALEPGHSKSLMAGYIVAVKGTKAQAVLLGLSAAIGHSIVVWVLAGAAIYFGDKLIVDKAEPWLELLSGVLIIALAARLYFMMYHPHDHSHDHDHEEGHDHDHAHGHGHKAVSKKPRHVSNFDIAWFGFTGGLLPCPSAIAVLLVCIQLRAWGLGLAMVFAFSLGLAITMVSIGVLAAAGAGFASSKVTGFDKWAGRLPLISSIIVMVLGLAVTLRGLFSLGLL
jgi:nickel/cobalt transporter (NicO) family protein